MPSESYSFLKRQKPTRMPYSCHAQLGTSGSKGTPVGAGSTWRAIGRAMSQTSRFTMVQTITLAPPGNFRGGRSTMAENSARSRGIMVMATPSVCVAGRGGHGRAARIQDPFQRAASLRLQLRHGHHLLRGHDEAEGGPDAQQGGVVQRRRVHGVDA